MSHEQPRTIHLDDPSALRAMAHPLRLRIVGSLRSDGPQTVGTLSERLDAAPGSISYHLGTLERHGFVEVAPELARDGRESWWRASAESTTFNPVELQSDPERRVAGRTFRQAVVQRLAAEQLAYLEYEEALSPEWVGAAAMGDSILWLAPEELHELSDELRDLVARWTSVSDREREGVAPVHVIYSAFRRA